MFFHQPNYDALIECLPTCRVQGEEAHHAPISSGDHLYSKFVKQTTFGQGVSRLMVGISLASFISERFVELFEFYSRRSTCRRWRSCTATSSAAPTPTG